MIPKQIIVRMPNWIGDIVMATPVLIDLKEAFPDACITAMCKKPLCTLLEHEPVIDELYCFSKSHILGRRNERRQIVEKIRRGKYDLGIILPNSFSSAWYFWQGNVKNRLGYRGNFRSFLLTHPVSFSSKANKQHLVTTYKELLIPLGIKVSHTKPRLILTREEKKICDEMLKMYGIDETKPVVGIHPGAAYGSAKCWLPERFKEVAMKLLSANPDLYILFLGDETQTAMIKDICQGLSHRAVNLAGVTSLRQLMAIIHRCKGLLTNDSGPMHMAAALNVPLVALFGSTNDEITGPYRTGVVIHKHVSCSPCFKRTCPIDFRCMKSIQTQEVFEELMKILEVKIS